MQQIKSTVFRSHSNAGIPNLKNLIFKPFNIERIMINPANFYDMPDAVLHDSGLSTQQQKDVLKNWEFDARELDVADDENMSGGPPGLLSEVLKAIDELEDK